jgi:hypothetical protein
MVAVGSQECGVPVVVSPAASAGSEWEGSHALSPGFRWVNRAVMARHVSAIAERDRCLLVDLPQPLGIRPGDALVFCAVTDQLLGGEPPATAREATW